jgi:putative membrane protein
MDWSSLTKGLISAGAFSLLGIFVFLLAFFLMAKLLPFPIHKEIEEDQNTALAILMGSVIIGLALIVAAAVG